MEERYYHQRLQKWNVSERVEIGFDFFVAWQSTMRELHEKDYFAESFGNRCFTSELPYGIQAEKLQHELNKELGDFPFWGFDVKYPSKMPQQDRLFSFIEFLYKHVSKPIEFAVCSWCLDHRAITKFSRRDGCLDFTIKINELFRRYVHPYKLKKGRIIRIDSPVLDQPLMDIELETDDRDLEKLLRGAIDDFLDRSGQRKKDALSKIAQALERIKTIEIPDDKKKSTEAILEKLTPETAVRESLNEDLKQLAYVANNYMIRHFEYSKKPIDDDDFVEFYFYLFFNYVRLILKKYNLLQKKKMPAESPEDDIPF